LAASDSIGVHLFDPGFDTVYFNHHGYLRSHVPAMLESARAARALAVDVPGLGEISFTVLPYSSDKYLAVLHHDDFHVQVGPRLKSLPAIQLRVGARVCFQASRDMPTLCAVSEAVAVALGLRVDRTEISSLDIKRDQPRIPDLTGCVLRGVGLRGAQMGKHYVVNGTRFAPKGKRSSKRDAPSEDRDYVTHHTGEAYTGFSKQRGDGIGFTLYDKIRQSAHLNRLAWFRGALKAAGHKGPLWRLEFKISRRYLSDHIDEATGLRMDDPRLWTAENLDRIYHDLTTRFLRVQQGRSVRADQDQDAPFWKGYSTTATTGPISWSRRQSIPVAVPLFAQSRGCMVSGTRAVTGTATASQLLAAWDKLLPDIEQQLATDTEQLIANITDMARTACTSGPKALADFRAYLCDIEEHRTTVLPLFDGVPVLA
jgi:hypothetical protein